MSAPMRISLRAGERIYINGAVLRAEPSITWHFCDDVVVQGKTDVDPSYSTAPASATLGKLIPDNLAVFSTEARDRQ